MSLRIAFLILHVKNLPDYINIIHNMKEPRLGYLFMSYLFNCDIMNNIDIIVVLIIMLLIKESLCVILFF